MLTPFPDQVLIIKEDNRLTEQTFAVLVVVDNPLSPVLPATLQSVDPNVEFDYTLSVVGQESSLYLIPPEVFNISFNFSLNGDNFTEGFEAFVASSEPGQAFPTTFQMPAFMLPTAASASTQIGIIDNDGEHYCSRHVMTHML